MRVPYAPSTAPDESVAPIYERIAARRAPRPLIPLDLALLHSPPVADGWNSFIGAIRTKMTLADAITELAISRVAVLNQAVHEWNAHAPLALKGGISTEGLESARNSVLIGKGDVGKVPNGGEGGLGAREWAVLAYTDQMTRGVEVDEEVSELVKTFLNDREVVELTATVAAYNCVSRFLVALNVGEDNGKPMKSVQELAG